MTRLGELAAFASLIAAAWMVSMSIMFGLSRETVDSVYRLIGLQRIQEICCFTLRIDALSLAVIRVVAVNTKYQGKLIFGRSIQADSPAPPHARPAN